MHITIKNPPEFIIFDWDGTLVDSIGRILDCFQESYDKFGLPFPELKALRNTIGLPLRGAFLKMKVGLEQPGIDALCEAYRDFWLEPDRPVSAIFPNVLALLDRLKKAGHTLAVATGKSRAGLNREMGHHGIDHYFSVTRCGDEAKPKPDPDMLNHLLEVTGFPPEKTLMLGDSPLDLAMANRAGIPAIGVLTGTGDQEALIHHQPLACLPNLDSLDRIWLEPRTEATTP